MEPAVEDVNLKGEKKGVLGGTSKKSSQKHTERKRAWATKEEKIGHEKNDLRGIHYRYFLWNVRLMGIGARKEDTLQFPANLLTKF